MQSYVYKLSGQFEQVEKSARNLDKAFRALYNVHGTNRITSWFDKETGTYNVQLGLMIDWWDCGWARSYDLCDVLHIWHRRDSRQGLEDVVEYQRVD